MANAFSLVETKISRRGQCELALNQSFQLAMALMKLVPMVLYVDL
jgi:hypothetical protein